MKLSKLLIENKRNLSLFMLALIGDPAINLLISYCLSLAVLILYASNTQEVIQIVLTIVVLIVIMLLIGLIAGKSNLPLVKQVTTKLRILVLGNILDKDLETYQNQSIDDYSSWLTSDINRFEVTFFPALSGILSSIGMVILGGGILLFINVWIGLLIIVGIGILSLIMGVFEKPVLKSTEAMMEENVKYHRQVKNILNGLEVIKLHKSENRFRIPFIGMTTYQEQVKAQNYYLETGQMYVAESFVMAMQLGLVLLATYFLIIGDINLTQLIFIFNAVGQVLWFSVSGISKINNLKSAVEIYNKIVIPNENIKRNETFIFEKQVDIKNLHVSYGAQKIINNFNAQIYPGDKVLIYGPSGTGKTTLLNCLSQTKTDYEGEIKYDKASLNEINTKSFLNKCGYIRQSHFMFEDSIKNNIILDSDYDEAKFNQILENINLKEWIESLDDKENHILENNGNNVSGGQRQRISIARELYHDCDVLFVDEPSASLDDESSKMIYDSLLNLKQTVFCVSHRHLNYLNEKFDKVFMLGENHETV